MKPDVCNRGVTESWVAVASYPDYAGSHPTNPEAVMRGAIIITLLVVGGVLVAAPLVVEYL